MKNITQMLKQAQKMQEQLQKQMEDTVVEASAGGGMVSVKMNGNKHLLAVEIDSEVMNDREMLQDMIVAAVNDATRRVEESMQSQLGSLTAGLKIPGM